MLIKNVWHSRGLYNGSLGTVRGLVFHANASQPYCILVEFDDYTGPSVVEGRNIIPIVTETVPFDPRSGKTGSRQQFPLVLGWAITIHKSQGLAFRHNFPWDRMEKINNHVVENRTIV